MAGESSGSLMSFCHVVQQENVPCEIGSILSSLCGWAGRHWRFHQEIDHQTLSVWACGPQ